MRNQNFLLRLMLPNIVTQVLKSLVVLMLTVITNYAAMLLVCEMQFKEQNMFNCLVECFILSVIWALEDSTACEILCCLKLDMRVSFGRRTIPSLKMNFSAVFTYECKESFEVQVAL